MALTRRSALTLSSAVLGSGFAGCSRFRSSADNANSSTSTTSPTGRTSQTVLTFSAEILQQASAEAPARVNAHLSNDGPEAVEVGFGPALLFTDDSASSNLDWADRLVLEPETYVGPWDDPTRTEDGCWRFPEDGSRLLQSSLEWREIAPQGSIHEVYEVYTYGNSLPCLPEGTFRFQDEGHLGSEDKSIVLTLVLNVDENQQLTATTEDPTVTFE